MSAPSRPPPPSWRAPAAAALAGLAVLAGVWAAILDRAASYEREEFHAAEQYLANLGLAFEEGLSRSLTAVDQALLAIRDLHGRDGLSPEVKNLTGILAGSDPMIVSLGFIGADGDILHVVNNMPSGPATIGPGTLNVADRVHFQVHVPPGPDRLYVSPPNVGRVLNRWLVFLTRRITRPDGSFGGLVLASVDAEQLGAFYKKIDLGPDGVVTVIGLDGIARVRVATASGTRYGDDLRGTPVVTRAKDTPVGIAISTSIVDNTERMLAFRRLRDAPLIVTVASGTAAIRRHAREQAFGLYLAGGALTLAGSVSAAALAFRWRREHERRRQAVLLEAIFVNMGEGITVVDRELRLVAWNDRIFDMIGVDPVVLRYGTPMRDILMSQILAGEFGPGDPEAILQERLNFYASPQNASIVRTRPDGRRFELRRRVLPDGGYLTVFLDISELKNAEDALRAANARLEHVVAERTQALAASERRLSRAQEMARVGHWVRTGGAVEYSRAAAAIFGVSPEELAIPESEYIARFVHPGDRAQVEGADRTARPVRLLEYRIVRPDGGIRAVVETIEHGVDGAEETIGTIHDVTDLARAEREAAAAHAILLDAIESIDNAIVLYDRDDRVQLFNERFLNHWAPIRDRIAVGMRYEDMLRLAVAHGLMAVPDGQDAEAFVAATIVSHRQANGTRFLRHGTDGRVFEIWENRSRNGGIVAVGLEMTERLQVEQQLRQAQRMEAIGSLTGGIAHDFNNLLAIVTMNLETLATLTKDDARAAVLIADSLTAAASGAGLTQRLLAFARRQNLVPATVSPNELIERMAGLMRRVLGENIEIALDLSRDAWPVFIDPAQLEASVLNLATNARDAMPDGGRLTLATRNLRVAADGPLAISGLEAGDHVEIAVTDTGAGMTAEVKGRIFEPFFTTKETGRGSGLGLSMVFGFLKQSKGLIAVDSDPGLGTTFRMYLPRSIVDLPAGPPPMAPVAARAGGETVLVVEDNDLLRTSFVRQLTSLGYRVEEASDARKALAMLEAGGIDLVLSDVLMPGDMNGTGLAREIGARFPSVGVILTSGFAEDRDRADPSVRFLAKPVRRQALARAVREALDA